MTLLKLIFRFHDSALLYILSCLLATIASILQTVALWFMKTFLNRLVDGELSMKVGLTFLFLETAATFLNGASAAVSKRLKGTLMGNLIVFPFKSRLEKGRFEESSSAVQLADEVTSGAADSQLGGLLGVVKVGLFVAGAFALDRFIGAEMGLFFVISSILAFINAGFYSRRYSEVLDFEMKLKSDVRDTLMGREDIKLMCAQEREIGRFEKNSKKLKILQRRLYSVELVFSGILQRVVSTVFLFLIVYRGFVLRDVGIVVAASRYFTLVSREKNVLLSMIDKMKEGNATARKLLELL